MTTIVQIKPRKHDIYKWHERLFSGCSSTIPSRGDGSSLSYPELHVSNSALSPAGRGEEDTGPMLFSLLLEMWVLMSEQSIIAKQPLEYFTLYFHQLLSLLLMWTHIEQWAPALKATYVYVSVLLLYCLPKRNKSSGQSH